MDVAVLRDRIVATLDQDADNRRRAELDLKTVSAPPFTIPQFWCPVLTVFSRPRSTQASPMPCLTFYKQSRRLQSACRVRTCTRPLFLIREDVNT